MRNVIVASALSSILTAGLVYWLASQPRYQFNSTGTAIARLSTRTGEVDYLRARMQDGMVHPSLFPVLTVLF